MKKRLLSTALICVFYFSGQAQGLINIARGSIITGTSTLKIGVECSYADNNGNIYIAGASKSAKADFDVFNPPWTPPLTTGMYFYIK